MSVLSCLLLIDVDVPMCMVLVILPFCQLGVLAQFFCHARYHTFVSPDGDIYNSKVKATSAGFKAER